MPGCQTKHYISDLLLLKSEFVKTIEDKLDNEPEIHLKEKVRQKNGGVKRLRGQQTWLSQGISSVGAKVVNFKFLFLYKNDSVDLRQYVLQATAVNKISHQYLYCIVRDRKYILQSYPSLVEELSVCLEGRVHHYEVGDLDQEGQ